MAKQANGWYVGKNKTWQGLAAATACVMALSAQAQMKYTPTQKSFDFEGSAGGVQRLRYPQLKNGDHDVALNNVVVDGQSAVATYANGTKVRIDPNENGLRYHFTGMPATLQMSLRIDFDPATMRKMLVKDGDGNPNPIPATPPENGFLVSGDGKAVGLVNGDGKGFIIGAPFGWVELRDARIWGNNQELWWQTFTSVPNNGGEGYYNLALRDPAAPVVAKAQAAPPPSAPAKDFRLALSDWGVNITIGEAGTYSLSYPKFDRDGMKDPAVKQDSANRVTLSYPNGAKAVATLEGGTYKIDFSGLPGGETRGRGEMYIPINFMPDGAWAFDPKNGNFPNEKAPGGKIFQGDSTAFTLTHATGMGFTVKGNRTFQELQDNREWGWAVFMWMPHFSLWPDNGNATLQWNIAQSGSDRPKVLVDRYGQWVKADFPGKVTNDQQLKDDLAADKDYYASLKPPQRDPYGGIPGTKAKYNLKATGFFHLAKVNGADVLVTPDGNLFFHLGVCGIMPIDEYTTVDGRESIYEDIPKHDPAFASAFRDGHKVFPSFHLINYIKKTGKSYEPKEYLGVWIDRLRAWGFTSAGAWGGTITEVREPRKFPFTEFLPIGGMTNVDGSGIWDPFAPGAAEKLDDSFVRHLAPRAKDPLVIGWFFNNEPHIENLPKILPTLDSKSAAKKKFVQTLQAKYKTIAAFNTAWEATYKSFDELNDAKLQLKTRAAGEDAENFYRLFLREYYGLINKAFRKHNPNHLLIGERLMPGTANSQTLIEEQGRVLDILSINYYTYGVDTDFLTRLHTWSGGKPMILSEFHYTSGEQGLAGGMRVATDRDRGLAYRNYLEQAAALKFIVGIEWFIAIDQATTGRFFQGFNGEAGNTGLVNVADRPYKAMLAEMVKSNYTIFDVILGQRKPYVYDDPRFTGRKGAGCKTVDAHRLTQAFKLDAARTEWPGVPAERIGKDGLVHGLNADGFEATFHVAWDDANLYLFADVSDPTPMKSTQQGGNIWSADAIELFIGYDQIDQPGSLKYCDRQILLRPSAPFDATASHVGNGETKAPIRLIAQPFTNGKGYSLEAAIPFANLGFQPKEGQTVLFDLAIDDSSDGSNRTRQSVWNGSEQNSKDRTIWGHLKFVP